MARKAEHAGMPHLLIDRFRFDSFAPDSSEAGSNLLTRFGREIYMFFMITPPHETVERAWRRGLEVGRYKAVDDTLAHNVEAYAGMPEPLLHLGAARGRVGALRVPRQQRRRPASSRARSRSAAAAS